MNIGVTSFPQMRLDTKEKGKQTRSIILPLLEQPLYLTAMSPSGFNVRRSQGLISCAPTRDNRKMRTSTMVTSATACFTRSQECLSKSICRIVKRTVRACILTIKSRMEWEDMWYVGLILWSSTRSLKKNEKYIWKLSRSKTICYIESPRIPGPAMKSIRSRCSGKKF